MEDKKAILVLEDGSRFAGKFRGVCRQVVGLVTLHTAVVGYQEIMTDPTNAGKIVVFTYPLIGNYGINEKFDESDKAWINAIIIKEESRIYSNWQATSSLDEFLKKHGVTAVTEVDTRTLAVKIRNDAEMLGIISSADDDVKTLLNRLSEFKNKKRESYLPEISIKKVTEFAGKKGRVAVIDLGVLKSITRQLSGLGLEVVLVPYDTEAEEILKLKPNGVVISNGPEEDPGLLKTVVTTRKLIGKIPLLGVSTGHLVIAQAIGAEVTKMKSGHHGLNYPVKSPDSLKGEITVQNHSCIVNESSLNQKDVEIVERNINDQTIEKLKSEKLKFISVQYYPLSPGLEEIHSVFREFAEMLKNR